MIFILPEAPWMKQPDDGNNDRYRFGGPAEGRRRADLLYLRQHRCGILTGEFRRIEKYGSEKLQELWTPV